MIDHKDWYPIMLYAISWNFLARFKEPLIGC